MTMHLLSRFGWCLLLLSRQHRPGRSLFQAWPGRRCRERVWWFDWCRGLPGGERVGGSGEGGSDGRFLRRVCHGLVFDAFLRSVSW